MSRCDVSLSYRMLCATLLCTALVFAVILTNVFVDIDAYILNRFKAKTKYAIQQREAKEKHGMEDRDRKHFVEDRRTMDDYLDAFENNDSDNYDDRPYRTKRSLDFHDNFPANSEKTKSLIKIRLNKMLEQLDKEQDTRNNAEETTITSLSKTGETKYDAIPENEKSARLVDNRNWSDMIHLAVDNMLLQDIVRHMDLKDFFKEFHTKTEKTIKRHNTDAGAESNAGTNLSRLLGPNINIKATVEILPTKDIPYESDKKLNEHIKKIFNLMYNEKSVKVNAIDGEIIKQNPVNESVEINSIGTLTENVQNIETVSSKYKENCVLPSKSKHKSFLREMLAEYFTKYANVDKSTETKSIETNVKRSKRHASPEAVYNSTTEIYKLRNGGEKKKSKEKLYIEIETHVGDKGIDGEKKKKLINHLIAKIQKAIHSDLDKSKESLEKKPRKHLHVRKRTQNPLNDKYKRESIYKTNLPLDSILPRQLDPIGYSAPENNQYKSEELLWNTFNGGTKSVSELNSSKTELNEEVEIKSIPGRKQIPLGYPNTPNYKDPNNMNFVIKDIGRSGFSIGFSQYEDQPPDAESINLFTGVENLIKTYHQTYDTTDEPKDSSINTDVNFTESHEITKRDIENILDIRHTFVPYFRRKKFNEKDSDEYKLILDYYKSKYGKMPKTKMKSAKLFMNKNGAYRRNAYINKLMMKEMLKNYIAEQHSGTRFKIKKPKIYTLQRNKRSLSVKRYTKSNSRLKIDRFLNKKVMSKGLYLKEKRNKRQINKDALQVNDNTSIRKKSEEDVYIVSDDEVVSNQTPVGNVDSIETPGKHYDFVIPYHRSRGEKNPPHYNHINDIFDSYFRNLPITSKYPHLFSDRLEEDKTSKEDYVVNDNKKIFKAEIDSDNGETIIHTPMKHVDEIIDALKPSSVQKTKYKFSVKLLPNNQSQLPSKFKEVRTTINKKYSENGVDYFSVVNVSEISNVESTNTTDNITSDDENDSANIKDFIKRVTQIFGNDEERKQQQMIQILRQHKNDIDKQLKNLKKEKESLKTVIKIFLGTYRPKNSQQFNKDNVKNVTHYETIGTENVTRNYETNEFPIKKSIDYMNCTTHETCDNGNTITTFPATITEDPIKIKMLEKIIRNENITNDIMKRIEVHTELLQLFLRKLTSEAGLIKQDSKPSATTNPTITEKCLQLTNFTFPKEPMFFERALCKLNIVNKNESGLSAPPLYTYPQQLLQLLPMVNNEAKQGIYPGHILTNGHIQTNNDNSKFYLNNKNGLKYTVNTKNDKMYNAEKKLRNGTNFFINDLERYHYVTVNKRNLRNDTKVLSTLPLGVTIVNSTVI